MKTIKPATEHFLSSDNLKLLLFLFLAWSLAVTQPLMSVFGAQPVFLIAHEVRGWLFASLTLAFNFIPPLILWISLMFMGLISIWLKEIFMRITMFFLLFLFLMPMVSALPHVYAALTAIFISILLVYLLVKKKIFKIFAQWFSLAGLLFVFTFLFISPAKQLLPTFVKASNVSKALSDSPIFVIVLDEFPLLSLLKDDMQIDEKRFPTFAQLSKEATWYPNALAIASATELALPAIISGIKPSLNEVRMGTYEQYPYNLFTQFSSTHKIHAIENSTRMCPSYLCQSVIENPYQLLLEDTWISFLYKIYPQNIKNRLPPINDRWIGFMREIKREKKKSYDFSERTDKFETFYSSFKKYPQNTLHFLHVLLPHAPWTLLPNLNLYGFYEKDGVPGELDKVKDKTLINHMWTNDQWATDLSWRKHLLQVGAVDKLVSLALEKIKSLNLYDNATIIIVADHGASFIPRLSRRYAHSSNIPDIARIPLFIKYPFQKEGKIDYRHASNLDIFPTLLDIFSVTSSEKLDGMSLLGKLKRPTNIEMIQEKFAVTRLPENSDALFKEHLNNKNHLFVKPGWQGVFHPKDSEDFFGKDVSSLKIDKVVNNAIELKNANLYKNIKKDSKYIPSYYRLTRLLDDSQTKEILVAINGKLVSHCFMFVHAPKDCAGLIAPEVYNNLSEQPLHLQFFAVKNHNEGAYTVDELIDINDVNAELIAHDNKEFIRFNSNKQIPINTQSSVFGSVSLRLIENRTTYHLDGWAGDTLSGQAATKVLVFIDNKLFSIVDGGIPKPYLFTRYGSKSFINSGFQVTIPFAQYPDIQQHNIRIFATVDNVDFNELNYQPSKQHELFNSFNTKTNQKIPSNAEKVFSAKLELANIKKVSQQAKIDAFNEAFELINAGDWLPARHHKRWIGSSVYVKLTLKNMTNIKELKINLSAKPMIYKNVNTQQRVRFYLNNNFIKEVSFTKKDDKTIILDSKILSNNGDDILKLEMPDAVIPRSHDKGLDSRFLSFYVYKFTIEGK